VLKRIGKEYESENSKGKFCPLKVLGHKWVSQNRFSITSLMVIKVRNRKIGSIARKSISLILIDEIEESLSFPPINH